MIKVEMFQCELCKKVYGTEKEAVECEEKGKEIPLVKVGAMINYEKKVGGGFDSFYEQVRVSETYDNGHYIVYSFEKYDEDFKEWDEFDYMVWGNEEYRHKIK